MCGNSQTFGAAVCSLTVVAASPGEGPGELGRSAHARAWGFSRGSKAASRTPTCAGRLGDWRLCLGDWRMCGGGRAAGRGQRRREGATPRRAGPRGSASTRSSPGAGSRVSRREWAILPMGRPSGPWQGRRGGARVSGRPSASKNRHRSKQGISSRTRHCQMSSGGERARPNR